ncbi:putative C2HC5-type zinc finger motif protein [Theileria parva strain Muguga]|uniref:putative C2HC5-type zinc finger motif protein n=1 Tax=Theileria parva strain Muguga TaxID=333668 RepID=UPI001C619BFE|nr:putative C2HC5-type zinc finger motif protein [Theileria parva strain Muguga]EAN33754.2 putative C2HC5-type zinc finger motif protein [Theileria parva strain Muguga]
MDEGEKPHLIPYRKDSTQIFFKVDKKNKFQPSNKSDLTPVSSKQRDSVERKRCDCGGSTHVVFSNCMSCGRLCCNLEKEGPCMDCNGYVYPVDSSDIPKDHLDNPDYKNAVNLRDKLLSFDNMYQSEDFKVNDLKSGWFEEFHDIYNDKCVVPEFERTDQDVLKYDLDLYTGRLSVSNFNQPL